MSQPGKSTSKEDYAVIKASERRGAGAFITTSKAAVLLTYFCSV
jgi:hypothetical protein